MKNVEFKIALQGAPLVNHGTKRDLELALVELDMRTKYCEVAFVGDNDGTPEVGVQNSERSPPSQSCLGHTPEDITLLAFPEYKGWRILSAECARYTVRLVFGRDKT